MTSADRRAGPRLVASDLDGTLLRADGSVSDRTRDAIAALEDRGIGFVTVTGRPVRWMAEIADQTGHRGLAICSNGAVVYDLHTETILETDLLDSGAAAAVVEVLRAAVAGVAFAVEHAHGGFGHEEAYADLIQWDPPSKTVAPVEDLVAQPLVKLLARHPTVQPDELIEAARQAVGDLATVTYGGSDGLLEISGVGVTKASGLARYATELGINAAEVVAFGDMDNDIPMLEWAGIGVAVANAHPDVIDVCDEVTSSNQDDGVAEWLERHLLTPTPQLP